MREKLKVRIPVLVEGKYDKNTLSQVIDANIFTTGGFSVFRSSEKQLLFRRLAAERGMIVLTDSDGGGKQIRSFLSGILPKDKIHMLYIPKIEGKEKRKSKPSKSGMLGVEGMSAELLFQLFLPFADKQAEGVLANPKKNITKTEFYLDGFTGADGAAERRARLALALGLPSDMTANALLEALNLLYGLTEYKRIISEMDFTS